MKPILTLLLLLLAAPALAQNADLPQHSSVPGGVAVLELPADADILSASYRGERVYVLNSDDGQVALVGIPLAADLGSHTLELTTASGGTRQLAFTVNATSYGEQHLT